MSFPDRMDQIESLVANLSLKPRTCSNGTNSCYLELTIQGILRPLRLVFFSFSGTFIVRCGEIQPIDNGGCGNSASHCWNMRVTCGTIDHAEDWRVVVVKESLITHGVSSMCESSQYLMMPPLWSYSSRTDYPPLVTA